MGGLDIAIARSIILDSQNSNSFIVHCEYSSTSLSFSGQTYSGNYENQKVKVNETFYVCDYEFKILWSSGVRLSVGCKNIMETASHKYITSDGNFKSSWIAGRLTLLGFLLSLVSWFCLIITCVRLTPCRSLWPVCNWRRSSISTRRGREHQSPAGRDRPGGFLSHQKWISLSLRRHWPHPTLLQLLINNLSD